MLLASPSTPKKDAGMAAQKCCCACSVPCSLSAAVLYMSAQCCLFAEPQPLRLPQDGQLASFMAVARRQIKYLEDRVKEVQRMP